MKFKKNLIFYITLVTIVFVLQFILANKHLLYGFNNDDWYVLAWYQKVVTDPVKDIVLAWTEIGPHNFSHAYYIGPLFEMFKFNYSYYHILNTIFKALASISLFPLVYALFKNRFLAIFATFLFAIHFTPFGALNNVLGGEDFLMVASMNLFLALYIWASQNHKFNFKITALLVFLLLAASFFDLTRFYPVLILLPLLEILNLWLNRSSTTLKSGILRLFLFYLPFIALVVYSPQTALQEGGVGKLTEIFRTGNYQLFISLFASFGSIFVPAGLLEELALQGIVGSKILYQDLGTFLYFFVFRFLVIVLPAFVITGFIVFPKPNKFILVGVSLNIIFVILAALAANHWIYLKSGLQAAVDPRVYFVSGLTGLFIISTAISFFAQWLKERSNHYLLALGLAPFFSLLYTFLTWIMVSENAIFTGVHAYLNIASIGVCIFLVTLLYLAVQNFKYKSGTTKSVASTIFIIYFFVFVILSWIQVDKYYSFMLKDGYSSIDQERLHESFWKEVGKVKNKDNIRILVFVDGSEDYPNGSFYSNAFVEHIPRMLSIERGEPFDPSESCKAVISHQDWDKIKVEIINGQEVIIQKNCGYDIFYSLENFYAFKMINRNLVSIKSEVIKKLKAR